MKNKLRRNIKIIYWVMALENMLFWSAIWVLYYLRYSNYAGIGLIVSVMIVTVVIGEIPTGAIADLLGKKQTLIVAFLLGGIGNLIMGFAPSYPALLISVFIMAIGHVLQSGAVEALIYDSLKSIEKQDEYEKVLGNLSTIKMLVIGIASILGGLMYKVLPGLPYIILGLARLLASFSCLWLVEPPIDTQKFSLSNYLSQAKSGVKELFKLPNIAIQSIIVISLSMITMINGHILIDAQIVNQGWSETSLGIISAVMFFLSAGMSQLTPFISKIIGRNAANLFMALLIGLTMILIPWMGIFIATFVLMMRNGLLEIFGNTASSIINHNTASKYRATALSAYNMLANLPYVLTAFLIGNLMDTWSIDSVSSIFGTILVSITIVSTIYLFLNRKENLMRIA